MLIAALVVGALACLLLGLVLDEIALTYTALGISLLGIAVLAAVKLWWRRTSSPGDPEGVPASPDEAASTAQPDAAPAGPDNDESEAKSGDVTSESVGDEPKPDAESEVPSGTVASAGAGSGNGNPTGPRVVRVIPGRRRYHIAICRLLDAHPHEQITLEEAHDEGFTACTTCVPAGAGSGTKPGRD